MKKLLLLFCSVFGLGAANAMAATLANGQPAGADLASPTIALLSPTGGRLHVTQKLPVRIVEGEATVEFALPGNSQNLQLEAPGHTIARWGTTPAILNPGGELAGRRARIEAEKTDLTVRLMAINTRLALWQAKPDNASAQQVADLQEAIQRDMPALAKEQANLDKRLKLVQEELARMPQASGVGEKVIITLTKIPAEREITVNYSYYHDNCGWDAVYDFNAEPDEGNGDVINVRFLAEVWQFTGIDWTDTHITLATKGFGPREPEPLPEWVIDSAKRPIQPRLMMKSRAAGVAMMADNAAPEAVADMAPVDANANTVYATWTLTQPGLPQGRSRLQIMATNWKAPMQWLARPSVDSNQVWLFAKYDLRSDEAWPAGMANYSVNGQSIGQGMFEPKAGKATLYFGADPRVTVRTIIDSRKHGKSGIINSNKTWTWDWTYVLSNQHKKPVRVRLERPEPMIVDEDVKATYANKPEAKTENHMLYWEIEVPAGGSAKIEHGVTITAPARLPLSPETP